MRHLRPVDNRNSRGPVLGFLALLLTFAPGCATSALWEEGNLARFHGPATPSNLELFDNPAQTNAVAVYDESTDSSIKTKRRAVAFDYDKQPPQNPTRPEFLPINKTQSLKEIPILDSPREGGSSAVLTNNTQAFLFFRDQTPPLFFELPVYEDRTGPTLKVALTPIAVIADLTIIGGFIFIYTRGFGFFN